MENLFYSPAEEVLFYIADTDKAENILAFIKNLKNHGKKFSETAGVNLNEVGSFFIKNSNKFRGMRVFHAHSKNIPAKAKIIDKELSLISWILIN